MRLKSKATLGSFARLASAMAPLELDDDWCQDMEWRKVRGGIKKQPNNAKNEAGEKDAQMRDATDRYVIQLAATDARHDEEAQTQATGNVFRQGHRDGDQSAIHARSGQVIKGIVEQQQRQQLQQS